MRGRVFKRSNTWTYVVDVGIRANGRRKQKSKGGFATRRAAEEALSKVISAVATGDYVDPTKLSFERYILDHWLPALHATVRPLTWEAYERHCQKYLVPAFGGYPLGAVPVTAINTLYGRLLRPEPPGPALSASTVRRIHATLHKALADALRWQLITRNAAAFADPPRAARPEMSVWSAVQLQAFLALTRDDHLSPLWQLIAFTGARRGEALGLRWSDLDLERGRATIWQTILPIGHQPTVGEPKTARGRRSVALDRRTVEALYIHRRRQLEQRLLVGPDFHDQGLVFAHPDGRPLNPEYVSRRFQRLVRSSGLPPVRLHDLRHTHATLALAAGVPTRMLSDRLGHSAMAVTTDIYQHAIPDLDAEFAERIASLVAADIATAADTAAAH
jgi:integrase